jgi:hypothetical protein
VGGASGTCWREKMRNEFWWINRKEGSHLGFSDHKMLLKNLQKIQLEVADWINLAQVGCCRHGNENVYSIESG